MRGRVAGRSTAEEWSWVRNCVHHWPPLKNGLPTVIQVDSECFDCVSKVWIFVLLSVGKGQMHNKPNCKRGKAKGRKKKKRKRGRRQHRAVHEEELEVKFAQCRTRNVIWRRFLNVQCVDKMRSLQFLWHCKSALREMLGLYRIKTNMQKWDNQIKAKIR